ncbi:MAG: 50S ribosomal protein L25 [Trueperaceae bacterium]|nr:50S ribosomal protein L25 [Trueperaceae bacterium]
MRLNAEKRVPGTAAQLRRAGMLPGIVYNQELNEPIAVELRAFDKAFRAQGTSSLIDLVIDGTERSVVVKQVQMDKRRREPMHVDFYAVTADRPLEVNVPIELRGTPVGVREGGLLDVQRREVKIAVLPRFIPNHVEIDVGHLAIGESLHVRDLVAHLPGEAHVLDDLDLSIAAVVPPRVADEAETEAAPTEPEVIGAAGEEQGEG